MKFATRQNTSREWPVTLHCLDSLVAGLGGVCAAATCGTIAVFRSNAQRYEQIHKELAPKPRSTCFQ